MRLIRSLIAVAAISASLISGNANAALTILQTYVGNYGVSTDGWGSVNPSGAISASVPVGAAVTAAYLYTSTYDVEGIGVASFGGTLAGSAVSYSSLGTNTDACCFLTAGRADVTSIIKPLIDGGLGGIYDFTITETNPDGDDGQDGSALVVVYELPSLPETTIGILDGFASVSGETTTISFNAPLNPSVPDFLAEMRLGIGFSYDDTECEGNDDPEDPGPNQTSTVAVNGTVITTNAGCDDDNVDSDPANGNLIAVGGFNDPFSPLLPSIADDHERYNLIPYVAMGDTSITVRTSNASLDDNIFLAVFQVSGAANINEPTEVPEPLPLSLLGFGLLALVAQHRMSLTKQRA